MIADTAQIIDHLVETENWEAIEALHRFKTDPYYAFQPRPNCPAEYDEQSAFVDDWQSKFCICLGGNGSGKTIAAAHKTARYVLETRPPRDNCPFWIAGATMDQICSVCWGEKLREIIPRNAIAKFSWHDRTRGWPRAVMLKHPDNPTRIGWVLEFKSYEQGVTSMKSTSIGGYWFNEEVPYSIVIETQRGCRDYDSPGWADFTPIEIKSPEWLELYENPPDRWKFYHLNTLKNSFIEKEWIENFYKNVPEDMRETRQIGTFAILSGAVFKEWRESIHVIKPFKIPRDWDRIRGIDFGFNNPFCCVWMARDPDGRYYVYDEHYQSQKLLDYHAERINERYWQEGEPHYRQTFSDHDAQARAELSQQGIICSPARKEPKNTSIEIVRSHMIEQGDGKPKLFVFDTCTNLRREIRSYRWPQGTGGKNPRNPKDLPLDKDDHSVDAMRYALYSDYVTRHGRQVPILLSYKPDMAKHGILTSLRGRR